MTTSIQKMDNEEEMDRSNQGMDRMVLAEIDVQVATAKRYPRNITTFKARALAHATQDEETAKGCFYALPRKDKVVIGESIRLAEIVATAWGNLRCAAQLIADEGHFLRARGMVIDLENNVAWSRDVVRRVTDKSGRRYSDDMIAVAANAACSIALRNAILSAVPRVYVKPIFDAARKLAVGDATSLKDRRLKAVEAFGKIGVTVERVLARLSRPGLDDLGFEEIEILTGLWTAIKDGEIDVDEAFPQLAAPEKPGETKQERLARQITGAKEPKAPTTNGKEKKSDAPTVQREEQAGAERDGQAEPRIMFDDAK